MSHPRLAEGGPPAAASQPAADPAVSALIVLVDELITVIADENRTLAMGTPAAASHLIARKQTLSVALARSVAGVADRHIVIGRASPRLQARLRDRSAVLAPLVEENVAGLKSAIAATRRRVDAIMRAIREQATPAPGQYGASGRPAANRPAASSTGRSRYL